MNKQEKKRVIVIAGPTASGKSQLAIDVAKAANGVVINADSQQVYDCTPLLSACPDDRDKRTVPHRLYEIWGIEKSGSVVEWLNLAAEEIRKAWTEEKTPVVVGGTGLYIDNLINGTTPIPETKPEARARVLEMLENDGVQAVHAKLAEVDREAAARLNRNDTTRVRRAYEVWLDTGKTLTEWHKLPMKKLLPEAAFEVVKILPPQEELDERCFCRFDMMMEAGALQEAEKIYEKKYNDKLPAMRALGLPELLDYLKGRCSKKEAVGQAKLHSRQYAKRQRTWFANKLEAQVVLEHCYNGDEAVVKKIVN
ncbi:MAG: tRNA (adenosine(37)-N6)-dimethylallyltransferase MiaA [Alphaproteobacteria bacterium]|nr:tRNA (adenosine(37)-N6)-dimethylallyltransferase MiaA [Alphaproteobacteria bacterium]